MPATTVTPERQDISVVLIGAFNPRIFHPAWFAEQELIRPEERDQAVGAENNTLLLTPEVSRCDFGEDLNFECVSERLIVSSPTSLSRERLRTLSLGLLEKLPHTPVAAVGINHSQTYDAASEEEWHAIGNTLVPKDDIWRDVMETRPGMVSVTVEDLRPGPPSVRVRATVEPLLQQAPPYRFKIDVNWHGALLAGGTPAGGAGRAAEFIQSQWDTALDFAPTLANKIFEVIRRPNA